jgi:hypothetical protein
MSRVKATAAWLTLALVGVGAFTACRPDDPPPAVEHNSAEAYEIQCFLMPELSWCDQP